MEETEDEDNRIMANDESSRMELNRAFYEFERNASVKGYQGREVDSWFMMSSIWPAAALTSAYLYFIIVAGPRCMKGRKPYSLKPVLLLYNLAQVVFSTWMVVRGFKETYGIFLRAACTPSLLSPKTAYAVDSLSWYYLISKYFEFLDTIFFVLRGKWKQVTFLHVYHHANMAIFTWIFVKYVSGIQIFMLGMCNSFVHAVMYSYYLLAAFGPSISRFLWWKRYITRLQIIQFLVVIVYLVYLYVQGCNTPPGFILFSICNTSSFLILFLLFYAKAYADKKKLQ
ncbi:very long chain fatty acid elongase AAEL008004 isoform X1 [Halyomorpha halys]|uniref:very long chain fatty acid elongase AAEL008004 isoform X1 n=2 Tax=Halyomorpha halys TaxID=286706 RepID=UPI0006D4E6D9|nr:elongation of very long chain fatty acids protein AAEL008004-like isoform X2 [Halyomorpha halys]